LRLIVTQILAENGSVKRCVSSPEMPMKKTSAKFVSAIFVSILASSTLMAAPEGEKAADTCLLGPSASPPGGHWYYRVDRANKRNCWYLRQERERVARKPADEDSRRTEQAAVPAPPKKPVAQRSISDARAELPPPQPSSEQDTKVAATQRIPAAPVEAPRADNNQRAGTSDANLLSTAVASRWPDPLAATPSAAPPPAPATRVAETQSQPTPATAPPSQPAAPPAPPVAANKATSGKPALSLPMLLTVLVGGLSVLCVIGSAVFSRGNRRSTRRSRSAPMPPFDFSQQPRARATDDPKRRIEQVLAQIQKRSAA
jgi:hypothetical protein